MCHGCDDGKEVVRVVGENRQNLQLTTTDRTSTPTTGAIGTHGHYPYLCGTNAGYQLLLVTLYFYILLPLVHSLVSFYIPLLFVYSLVEGVSIKKN